MSAATLLVVNPLEHAHVTAERIDQGVDYAGTGNYEAISPGVIVAASPSGGWESGGYVVEKITQGPLAGQAIYYEEGVQPLVGVGARVFAGQPVAALIPGAAHGTELGFAAPTSNPGANYIGGGYASYAQVAGGGYTENALTGAGQAFSNLIKNLGGPAGLAEGRSVTGSGPRIPGDTTVTSGGGGSSGSGILGTGLGPNFGPDLNPVDAVKSVFSGFFDWIKAGLEKGLLYFVLVGGGIALAAYGLIHSLAPPGAPNRRMARAAAEGAEL